MLTEGAGACPSVCRRQMNLSERVTLDSSGPNLCLTHLLAHVRLQAAAPPPLDTEPKTLLVRSTQDRAGRPWWRRRGRGQSHHWSPLFFFLTGWALLEELAVRRVEFAAGFGSCGCVSPAGSWCSVNPVNAKSLPSKEAAGG